MKKRHILIIAAMSLSFAATAQRTPDHNFDFETIHTDTGDVRLSWDNFHKFFDSWQAGTPPEGLSKIDDEFFISRQRPLPRITDGTIIFMPLYLRAERCYYGHLSTTQRQHGRRCHDIVSRATTSLCGHISTVMATGRHLGLECRQACRMLLPRMA